MLQQITEVQASLAALAQQAADNSIKIDALISLAQSSVNSGTPVTQEDLDALTQIKQQADAINQQIGTADAKADVALAPPPPAIALSPAPAATPTAPDRSTSVDPDPAS